jgi:hypothetical protein
MFSPQQFRQKKVRRETASTQGCEVCVGAGVDRYLTGAAAVAGTGDGSALNNVLLPLDASGAMVLTCTQ